jgi:membrane-associated phospholipid phosphatase
MMPRPAIGSDKADQFFARSTKIPVLRTDDIVSVYDDKGYGRPSSHAARALRGQGALAEVK